MKKLDSKLTTIYIVRHGETEWNVKGLLQGHHDSPLTTRGEQQAKDTSALLKNIHFDEVFSSDLVRAKRTAEIIALERKLAVKTTQTLREQRYGKFEGKPFKHLEETVAQLLKQYQEINDKQHFQLRVSDDSETSEEAVARFITFLREIAIGYKGKTILIVSHGIIMHSVLIHLGLGTFATFPISAIKHTAFVKLESDGIDIFVKETKGIILPDKIS